ncbi:ATP-binding protein [Bradyrhizobium sp. 182]|uniref:ATP-binding protein n=1 Tax=Bradyrhizobium sp. 182 TaxID=2782651 RepID=UPI0031F72F60|nr:ATP-binding protein [Bradyrhizobium sp. 182]
MTHRVCCIGYDRGYLAYAPAQPSLDPSGLASARWIANGENVLLLGPPCVGKTQLAFALGREAILAGHSVQFVAPTTVVAQLA